MHEYSWLFVNNPEKDFTRKRKLNFKEMLNILLSMEGNSLKLELMKYFSYDVETATCEAFVQQREKILPEAFEFLFNKFTASAVSPNYYDGYRMLAVDGSDLARSDEWYECGYFWSKRHSHQSSGCTGADESAKTTQ